MVIPGDLFDTVYNQASWNLQTYLTQTSYEHLKFIYGACSAGFYLCLGQKSGCPPPPAWSHIPGVIGITTLVRGVGAASLGHTQYRGTLL